jgi:DNA-binding PadR family transcriptional regulator
MADNLPELTHLQFAILDLLVAGTQSGKNVRKALKSVFDISKSGPAFYQMMARLEEAKFVEGRYEQEVIDGQIIKERNYKITGPGIRALNGTKSFYRSRTAGLRLKPSFS